MQVIRGRSESRPLCFDRWITSLVIGFKKMSVYMLTIRASQVALVVKNPLANARDVRDARSIPGSGRTPGGGHGNPLQYSGLENPMGRGA